MDLLRFCEALPWTRRTSSSSRAMKNRMVPAAMVSWGIHSGVASLAVEMSLNSQESLGQLYAEPGEGPSQDGADAKREDVEPAMAGRRSALSSRVTRMCSP